jgi:hypothetical protein
VNNIVEKMKNEEQRLKNELKSMKHGEERMKHEITLMKYRKTRMEYEIELMKSPEEIISIQTSIYNNEEAMNNELEQMKKYEKHMNYEIQRMKHYETRLINEIRSLEQEINCIQYLLTPEYYEEICQSEIEYNKHTNKLEKLSNERKKRQIKLPEHSNEIKKRLATLEEHSIKQIEFENKLKIVRNKIKQEKERRKNDIKRRENSEKELLKFCVKLLERSIERIRVEIQSVEDDEKLKECQIEYNKLCEELLEKREEMKLTRQSILSSPGDSDLEEFEPSKLQKGFSIIHNDYEISVIIEQPKYDIFISSVDLNNSAVACVQNALPQYLSTLVKRNFSWSDIKICLDNTNTAVIAIINKAYEVDAFSQAEMTCIFKRQFPLILVIAEQNFEPKTGWLNMIWQAFTTQKIFLNSPNFEDNLRNALTDSQWHLSSNRNIPNTIGSTADHRSKHFLGDLHEWTVVYSNPAQVSYNYRQLINDPFRIATDTKLQDIYYYYIRMYFENSDVMYLFEKGVIENDVHPFIQAYTHPGSFSTTLNRHLAANILYYFNSTLQVGVDYQLVKYLIDFVALCIYRQELHSYLFSGIVYRGIFLTEESLSKYPIGTRIINTTFLSTSKDKSVINVLSEDHQREFGVLCRYIIHNKNHRRTALDIGSISCFPDEREVLILPFSAFHVKSVKRSENNSRLIEMVLVEDDTDVEENIYTVMLISN